MSARTIVTALLLLFVASSVGVFVAKEMKTGGSATDPASHEAGSFAQPEVTAYYFHGTRRCKTCLTIEEYTKEALETGFAQEIEAGRLALKIINVDEPANEHFVQDFELDSRSVVLARNARNNGAEAEDWRQLNRVWALVGDKGEFVRYIQTETQAMLAGS